MNESDVSEGFITLGNPEGMIPVANRISIDIESTPENIILAIEYLAAFLRELNKGK